MCTVKNVETNISFMETCMKCNRPMRTEDGKMLGGMRVGYSFIDDSTDSTTCWECFLSKEN
jgi:hypothetical protein